MNTTTTNHGAVIPLLPTEPFRFTESVAFSALGEDEEYPCMECGRTFDDGPHTSCPSDDCPSHDTPITDAHMKALPYSWDYFDYETEKLLKKMETEIRQLREDVGKCHDAVGESRGSDTSELYKFFEHDVALIKRLRVVEDDLKFRRELFTLQEAQLNEVRDELTAARVRIAAYEYQLLRLANHQPRPLPDDKAEWPAAMYGRYMDLLAEFNDFKNAMSSYIGDSRVHEAVTHYETNNLYTN